MIPLVPCSLCLGLSCRTEVSWEWNEKLATEHGTDRLRHWKKENQRGTLLRKHAELAVKGTNMVQAFVRNCAGCLVSFLLLPATQAISLQNRENFMCLCPPSTPCSANQR